MASCNTSLVPLRVMLFAFYGAIGCVVPFLSLHMASLGLTADERSWVEFVAPLACGVGPLLGRFAASGATAVLACGRQTGCALHCDLQQLSGAPLFRDDHCRAVLGDPQLTFWLYFGLRAAAESFLSLALVLVSATTLLLRRRHGSDHGREALWGLLGLAITAPLTGYLLDTQRTADGSPDLRPGLCAYAALLLAALTLAALVTVRPGVAHDSREYSRRLARSVCAAEFFGVLCALAVLGALWGFLEAFLDGTRERYGWLTSADWSGEPRLVRLLLIPLMAKAEALIAYCGHHHVFMVAFIVYIVRYVSYAYIVSAWLLLVAESLEMFTVHLAWLSAVQLSSLHGRPVVEATLQAAVTVAHFGVGRGVGAGVVRYVLPLFSPFVVLCAGSILSAVCAALYLSLYHCCRALAPYRRGTGKRRQYLSDVVPAELPPSQRTSLEQRVRAMLRRPASEVHGGDTDSSEDEDNRQPFEQRYNEFGRTVKRIAHASASGTGRDRLQERAEHVNRAAQRALKPKTAAKKADGGRPAVPEQPHEEIMIDSFAKISVINPRLTSIELRDCLQGKRLIRVSQLESNVRADGIPGDWVTIGVIARKSDPRTSQKGSAYSSWTLTDLVDVQKPVKVMLFGEAHSALWKTTVGTVVALANSKVMKDKEMSGSTGITISVVSGKHCIMLGTSPDLDFCKAKCKNGRICLSFINKRHCPVCVFHMTAEYKKTGSKRGELQDSRPSITVQGVSSVAPKKPLGGGVGGAGGQIVHEGAFSGGTLARRDSETAAQRLKDRERLTSLRLQKQCEDTLNTKKKKLDTAGLKHISQAEAKAIANVAEDSMEMGELLLKPCAGARNLLRHLTKDSTESTSTDLAEPRPARRTAADPAAMLREEAARRRVAEKALAAPRLARHVTPGQTVDLDVSPQQRAVAGSAAKARALALLKKSGPLKKTDPNAVRSRPSDQRRELVKKRLEREADENSPGVPALRGAEAGPAAKRSRLADDPAFRAALEKKELVENKMLTTWEVKTKAVYCKKCKYRALSASDLCKSEGHTTILLDAVKRFFSCNNCKSRTISLDKLPATAERTGPKLESEILSIRGNEAFSINSHVKEHNINLEF
ncbi:Protein MCM10 [Amphibalanus amphitrite]|uniref:Protein MCM10 homolog n=1 Tax=Amphibalanus amphitrite TaxID=1232801 RepID=A0A6A4WIU8_AMPAM|nr:Protein MCM10 [Amphibalanus amphitrite]